MLKPGKYKGHVLDYGFRENKAKDAVLANILFEAVDGEGVCHNVYWQGSFKEKAKQITIDSLLTCGLTVNFSSAEDYKKFNQGKGSGCLNEQKEVELDIINEDYNGKTYVKVAWVNEIGSGDIRNKIAESDLIAKMPGMNLAGDIAAARQKKPAPTEVKNFAPGMDYKEQVPF